MKFFKKYSSQLHLFIKENYVIVAFCLTVLLIGCIVFFRILTKQEETIYVKVKVSQGLWWASTLRPALWLADSLQVGDQELGFSKKPVAEIIEVRKYPLSYSGSVGEQYEVFLIVKMKVGYNENKNQYTFKRSNIAVGGPIEYEFQKATITGTVTAISDKLFSNNYEEKLITLEKELVSPWEYDSIIVGDTYFDGRDTVLEVIDKEILSSSNALLPFGMGYPTFSTTRLHIRATVKMKVKKNRNTYIYKEEFPIGVGRRINLPFSQSTMNDFVITAIN